VTVTAANATMTRPEEVARKLASIRSLLDETRRGGALLTSQAGFAWVTAGGRSHISIGEAAGVASVLVTADEAYVLTTNIELRRLLDEELTGLPFEPVEYPWHEKDGMAKRLNDLCDTSRLVSDHDMTGATPDLVGLRFVMLPPEIDRYRALGEDAARAVESACAGAEPGDTEADVAARVAYECVARDILPLVDLVAADDRIAAYRHPLPTPNRVRHTLLVALTGRRHGLHASLTRMVSFGAPEDDLARRHSAVAKVDAGVLEASRSGVLLADAFAVLVDRYAAEGFADEWIHHHQGGLTGYAGREIFATPAATHRVRPNEVVAWNPSITRVKSEDTVLVGRDGLEILTRTGTWPETAIEVDFGELTRPALLVR
jgi:Xaa-Pro aminopeptidase